MKKDTLKGIIGANIILLAGCTNQSSYTARTKQPAYTTPSYDTSTQLKKFHSGYMASNLIGKSNCGGVFPQALLDKHIRGVMSKNKTKKISWIGECDDGLMYGKGSIKITPKEGSNIDYFHLSGFMDHGFFVGDVVYGYNPHNSSQIKNLGIKHIKLTSYSDYVLYETPRGYNTSSTSSNDNGALIGLAVVALAGYGVYKLLGGGSDTSSSNSYSSYSDTSSSTEYQPTSSSSSNTEATNNQNESYTNPVKRIYDGGSKSARGYTISQIECSSGNTYDAYQESDGYWYSVGSNYGDSYKNLSKSEFADKICR